MGRLINYDSFVQEKLNEICKDKQAKSGLIIGQVLKYGFLLTVEFYYFSVNYYFFKPHIK